MGRRVETQMRRALKLPILGGRNLGSVAYRAGGICHLCGTRVAKRQRSRDHLVPEVAGGGHQRTNLDLAHAECNTARGDLPLGLARDAIREWRRTHSRPMTPHDCGQVLQAALKAWRASLIAE